MTYPLISIVMPTYNRADFLLETIESIRQQIYAHWELIVVDDGSDDNTEDLIKDLNDDRIVLHLAGRIGSIIQLRLLGISLSKGSFIAFMDSDDLWSADKLQKQIDAFTAYPEAGFSLTGGYNFREAGKPIEFFYKQQTGIRYGKILTALFRSEIAMIFPTLMVKRSCVDELVPGKHVNMQSDVDFLIELSAQFKAVVLYESLFYRRLHHSNSSTDDWEKGYADKIFVIKNNKEKNVIDASLANEALFKLYINYGETCLQKRLRTKAVQTFFKAWESRPYSIVPIKKTGKALLHMIGNK